MNTLKRKLKLKGFEKKLKIVKLILKLIMKIY